MNGTYSRAIALAIVLAGCEQNPSRLTEALDHPRAAAPASATTPPPAAGEGISGSVVETMSGAGYTYARLDRGGTQVWIAGPETKIAVGMQLGRMDGTLMTSFHSDSLNRTFDQIYFVNSFAMPAGASAAPSAPAAPAVAEELSGTVVETMNAGGYTYAHVDRAGTKLWLAGPETKLAVGAKLGQMHGSLMTDFRSDTLKRTFDQIYFINAYVTADGAAVAGAGSAQAPAPAATTDAIEKIAPAPDGKTVADVYAGKTALAGKQVVVRGKVVKINSGILGRNWLHLRDGTGAAGSNDLMVTSQDTAKVGDVVVAKGIVSANKDFGSGYRYDVIVENATLATK